MLYLIEHIFEMNKVLFDKFYEVDNEGKLFFINYN